MDDVLAVKRLALIYGLYARKPWSIEAAAEAPIETFEEDFRENVGRHSELRGMIVETMTKHDLDAIGSVETLFASCGFV